jgi:hypothetical protein
MKHYLIKQGAYIFDKTLVCLNENNLSRIEVWQDSDLQKHGFEDIEQLNISHAIYEAHGFILSDKKTFDEAYIAFTTGLNELAKEL